MTVAVSFLAATPPMPFEAANPRCLLASSNTIPTGALRVVSVLDHLAFAAVCRPYMRSTPAYPVDATAQAAGWLWCPPEHEYTEWHNGAHRSRDDESGDASHRLQAAAHGGTHPPSGRHPLDRRGQPQSRLAADFYRHLGTLVEALSIAEGAPQGRQHGRCWPRRKEARRRVWRYIRHAARTPVVEPLGEFDDALGLEGADGPRV